MLNKKYIECDLCVVGGGMSGIAAAISAAREGISVVLMHERPVLGGNASSEIRMWVCGARGENNRETGIIEEIALENLYRNPTKSYAIWDTVLYDFVKREENITLLLNCTCMDAEVESGEFPDGRERRIRSVTGYQMTTQCFFEVSAKMFADCSGDSILAPLTDAQFRIGRESRDEFSEDVSTDKKDLMTMGMSCLVYGRETDRSVKYTPPAWATKLTDADFENRRPDIYDDTENFWYLELGGDRDTIADTEKIRDELVPLAMGTWDYIKNSGNFDADRWDIDFLGFLPGKRESRRMVGEYIITQRDISGDVVFPDEIAYGGWPLDDHFPGGFYHRGVPNTDVQTPAPYSLPYRALYSKNVENLFFAGRNISMTHMAMSSIRVMATCSLLGEAVGKAAALAVKRSLTPHGVYLSALFDLQNMLLLEDCFLPSRKREISDTCKSASLNTDGEVLRNGEDRPHRIYGTTDKTAAYFAKCGESITYTLPEANIESVHIVFDSDLDRRTLPGSVCDRTHSTRACIRAGLPDMHMPLTLCREFTLCGEYRGERVELLHVTDNRKRAYNVEVKMPLDKLTLTVLDGWGDGDIPVISFDFR